MSKRERYSPRRRVAEAEARAAAEARLVPYNKKGELAQQYDLWIKTDEARQAALTLSPQKDEIISRAFKAHHLDWENPFAWKRLLKILSKPRYGDKLSSGRKREWTEAKLIELLTDLTILREKHPKWSELRICKELAANNQAYKEFNGATLTRRLPEARDLMLAVRSDQLQQWIREEADRRGVARTQEFEEKLAKRTRMDALRMLKGSAPRGRKPKELTKLLSGN
jgi:hypothetical protein